MDSQTLPEEGVKLMKRQGATFVVVLGIAIICGCFMSMAFISNATVVYALTANQNQMIAVTCPISASPTSRSLLIVLLDRSGSLVAEPGATDPKGYSTSVTRALADLWPGSMAVIPFSGDTTSLPVFGPADLSNPAQRADLKNSVEQYPIGGDTPLDPAMHQALELLRGAAPGSRVIVITDGNPTGIGSNDGQHQEQDIRQHLISQFCAQGIPVSVFGLTIDARTPDGQDANQLLTDITSWTRATYTNVRSPEELATSVISLYAQWQHLTFVQEKAQNGNFAVSIDSFARQVAIVAFRSDSSYQVTLDGPDGQPIQGIQQATDRHYVIDSLISGLPIAGIYTIHTAGDPDTQVYALVSSPLQIQINSPTLQVVAYGKPIEIEASILNGTHVVTPAAGQAQLVAHVTLLVNGRPAGPSNDVVLVQWEDSFSGMTLTYRQAGLLQIEVEGNYQGVQRKAITSLHLVPPPPPPSLPCRLGLWACLWKEHSRQVLIFTPPVFLLILLALAWLIRQRQLAPWGWLWSKTNAKGAVKLGTSRPILARILHKSVISSGEIENHPDALNGFRFGLSHFDLVYKSDGTVHLRRARGDTSRIAVRLDGKEQVLDDKRPEAELRPGGIISINGTEKASFETSSRVRTPVGSPV